MHNFIFRRITQFRENYWFWPSTMTLGAVILGFALPALDARLGPGWAENAGFIGDIQVEGARAILTTLASSTLGVAGVAFSVTMVAVSFASSNYGPRLIGNFMGDRTNQVVLGVFVATFVYCIAVLGRVHAGGEAAGDEVEAFVPRLSILFALLLTLAAVGALIGYIHHIPESINILNLTAKIGDKLQRSIVKMLEDEAELAGGADTEAVTVEAWRDAPESADQAVVRADCAGFLQRFDLKGLTALAREENVQITLHRAPGDFLVTGEPILSARGQSGPIAERLRSGYTQGANRTDVQDILFLSDQLVEVLGRALSPGVNDPHTAMLCLNWLRAGLTAFASRPPAPAPRPDDPVLYRRVAFEDMANRSFDRMRQYVAADRTVTLHALETLADVASIASRKAMADACASQMRRLAASAVEVQTASSAREEIEAALARGLKTIDRRAIPV